MQDATTKYWFKRMVALGTGVVLAGGLGLVAASPAMAVDGDQGPVVVTGDPDDSDSGVPNDPTDPDEQTPVIDTYYVGGDLAVATTDGEPWKWGTFDVTIVDDLDDAVGATQHLASSAEGDFEFEGIPSGDYTLVAKSTDESHPSEEAEIDFTVDDEDFYDFDSPIVLTALPSLTGGAVSYTGDLVVGSTLTGSTAAPFSPSGATVTYGWGYGFAGASGGEIEGATGNTLVLTDDLVGASISYTATATKPGYTPTTTYFHLDGVVTAPKKAAAPAPVANSSDLSAYLASKDAAPVTADTVGLPAAGLNPAKDYSAKVDWMYGDSFVDVYAYSTPTFVGTFPIVNGVAQVNLTSAQLTALGAGNHTLVLLGQSSGGVQSVAVTVTAVLASTGFDPALPMGAAVVLLVLGGGLVLLRRRAVARQ